VNETSPQFESSGRDEIDPKRRRNFWRFMLIIGVILTAAMASMTYRVLTWRDGRIGDGRDATTYGFDLSNVTDGVVNETLVASRFPKDGQPVLRDPLHITVDEVEKRNNRFGSWNRLVTSEELVMGVEAGGEVRAYPLKYVRVHEIVHDTLGGVPIAVTYSPLGDCGVAFDRGLGEEVLDFGFSGLMYNANLVMYDKRPDAVGESLWSQLKFKAIAGPKAGQALTLLPMYFGRYKEWRQKHPATTVMVGIDAHKDKYKRDLYRDYFNAKKLKPEFAIEPLVPEPHPVNGLHRFDRIHSYLIDGQWNPVPNDVAILSGATANIHCRWFAWAAMHGDKVWQQGGTITRP
jgi:hypothetical protein